ncbi:MAG: hypothetical protein Q7T46_05240 [Polaromonas sp.]|nr:hypothetical protein [Polaromonas sp.]
MAQLSPPVFAALAVNAHRALRRALRLMAMVAMVAMMVAAAGMKKPGGEQLLAPGLLDRCCLFTDCSVRSTNRQPESGRVLAACPADTTEDADAEKNQRADPDIEMRNACEDGGPDDACQKDHETGHVKGE